MLSAHILHGAASMNPSVSLLPRSATALVLSCVALVACTSEATAPSTGTDDLVNQSSADVTVLQISPTSREINILNGVAVHTGEAPSDPAFDVSKCTLRPDGDLDCTSAFEAAFGAPALHPIIVSSSISRCKVVSIQTVSKLAAVENSDGIGAYYAFQSGPRSAEGLVPKAHLAKVADATLKNGDKAIVHKFVGLGACDIGGRWGAASFKPYMQFTGADVYKNWDSHENYAVSYDLAPIDRTGELLK